MSDGLLTDLGLPSDAYTRAIREGTGFERVTRRGRP
ncbi:unnamed protein product, partial [marine sediment metagenome]